MNLCVKGDARIFTTSHSPISLRHVLVHVCIWRPHGYENTCLLVKDIDPAVLQRLLGTRSLATELTSEQLTKFTWTKPQYQRCRWTLHSYVAWWRSWPIIQNPLYKEKLKDVDIDLIEVGPRIVSRRKNYKTRWNWEKRNLMENGSVLSWRDSWYSAVCP